MVDQSQLVHLVRSVVAECVTQPERIAFDLSEASAMTGIPVKQLRFAIARRELRAKRIGKAYRITRSALISWLETP